MLEFGTKNVLQLITIPNLPPPTITHIKNR